MNKRLQQNQPLTGHDARIVIEVSKPIERANMSKMLGVAALAAGREDAPVPAAISLVKGAGQGGVWRLLAP
jgi:hypothetical protein